MMEMRTDGAARKKAKKAADSDIGRNPRGISATQTLRINEGKAQKHDQTPELMQLKRKKDSKKQDEGRDAPNVHRMSTFEAEMWGLNDVDVWR
jgi:hypothetical protein